MFRSFAGGLLLVSVAALCFPDVAKSQDEPPQGTPGAASMLATRRFLFVVHDGVLHQFDINTLKLLRSVRLGAEPSAPVAEPPPREPVAVAPVRRPAARAEPEVNVSPAAMTKVAANAVAWLVRHQDEDGRWDAEGFMKHDKEGAACDGAGNPTYDVGVTGLGLLALLAEGNTVRAGQYRENVLRAVRWLQEQQQENGLFGTNAGADFIYGHAIATYAMCEAYGLSDHRPIKPVAQKGLDYIASHRNPYGVWRYQPRDNDNDSSVTTWCVLACASGNFFGLQVDPAALKAASVWFDSVTGPDGHAGYLKVGDLSSRRAGAEKRFPPELGEAMTAAALLCRYSLGRTPEQSAVMELSANLLASKPPCWDQAQGSIDEYYWYFGTKALWHAGGRQWAEWQRKLGDALIKTQRRDGNFAGSWDPVGVWGETGGRLYTTALLALAAQTAGRARR
ncbi:MAG TPA: prenyltransferase/squalene oxidase repeat-containing protein [Planctomycetota bacterium]|nr:prenyltransferase/squalene oxidase repeat-containing protein [Planctomycetota bacterium]